MTDSYNNILDALRNHGSDIKETGHGQSKATAQCPAHDDDHPSLSISKRKDGLGVVICCHAGCDYRDVLDKVGLQPRDLFDAPGMRDIYNPRRDYVYPDGRTVHRKPDKSFPQSGNTKGDSLYRADRISDTQTVYVPEGEKDVEAIEAVGGAAVCPPMGAGQNSLDRYDWSVLRGKHVRVVADKDAKGYKHAAQVFELLRGIAASVRIVQAAVGKDSADHIAAGKTLDELEPITVPVEVELPADEQPLETRVDSRTLFPPPTAPLDVARKLYSQYRISGNGLPILLAWRGG